MIAPRLLNDRMGVSVRDVLLAVLKRRASQAFVHRDPRHGVIDFTID